MMKRSGKLIERLFRPAKKSGKRPPVFVYVGYLLVATVIFTGVTFSGYISTTVGSDQARVAKFDVDIAGSGMQEILVGVKDMMPGDIINKEFQITNSSEVAVELVITATLMYDNLPLDLTVSSMDAKAGATFEMAAGASEPYILAIHWPNVEGKNGHELAGKADMIRVVINVMQKD